MKLYVASQQPQKVMESYLRQAGLKSDGVLYAPHGFGGNVVHTPTLLLIDNKGVVSEKYVGYLDESQQDEVLRTISN